MNGPHLLILLGNGFDLAHGLKTSYRDFMDHLLEETKDNSTAKPPYIKLDNEGLEDPYIALDRNAKLKKHVLIARPDSGSIFFKHLFYKHKETKNWGNFEELYFEVLYKYRSGSDIGAKKRVNTINKEFEHLKKLLEEYLLKIENNQDAPSILNKNPEIIDLLSEKEKEYTTVNFINFNYTSKISDKVAAEMFTLRDTWDNGKMKFVKLREGVPNIFHIHGQLNSDDNPIVFGYGNDQTEKFKEILHNENDELLKYFKTFLYKENEVSKYVNDYLFSNENINVIVIGHSLSFSDKTILNKIFKHKNVKSIELVYHQDKSKYKKNLIQFARIVDDPNIVDQKVLSRLETSVISRTPNI